MRTLLSTIVRRALTPACTITLALFSVNAIGSVITIYSDISNTVLPNRVPAFGSFNLAGALSPNATISSAKVTGHFADKSYSPTDAINTQVISQQTTSSRYIEIPPQSPNAGNSGFYLEDTTYYRNILKTILDISYESVSITIGNQAATGDSPLIETVPQYMYDTTTVRIQPYTFLQKLESNECAHIGQYWERPASGSDPALEALYYQCYFNKTFYEYHTYIDSWHQKEKGFLGPFDVSIDLNSTNLEKLTTSPTLEFMLGAGNGWPYLESVSLTIVTSDSNNVPEPSSGVLFLIAIAALTIRGKRPVER